MLVAFTVLLAMSDVLWSIDWGRLGSNPPRPDEIVWSTGAGGPGGVALGQRHFRDIRRIDIATGKIEAKVAVAKELSFKVDQVHAWGDELIVLDFGGVGRPVSIRKGIDPLSNKATVRELPVTPYDREGKKTCAMTMLGWLGDQIVIGSRPGERPSQAFRIAPADLSFRVIDMPSDADEIRVAGNLIVVRRSHELRGYSGDGAEIWRIDASPRGEVIPEMSSTSNAKQFLTLRGARSSDGLVRATGVVARDLAGGRVVWEQEIAEFTYLRHVAIGPNHAAVIFSTHDEFVYDGKTPGPRWCVYDTQGSLVSSHSIAGNQEKPSETVVDAGVAIDARSGELVIGSSDGGILVGADSKIRNVKLPGSPRALSNGVVVCESGRKLVAIAIK